MKDLKEMPSRRSFLKGLNLGGGVLVCAGESEEDGSLIVVN